MKYDLKDIEKLKCYKSRMQWKVTAFLAFICALSLAILTPSQMVKTLFVEYSDVSKYLFPFFNFGIGGVIGFLLSWLLFAVDSLATGKLVDSRFFRHYYCTSLAVQKYPEIENRQLVTYWFELFNSWGKPSNPQHSLYKRTFERTYSLRLIYYLKYGLLYLAFLCSLFLLATSFVFDHNIVVLVVRVAYILVLFALYLLVGLYNKLTETESTKYFEKYDCTGAYYKYKEFQLQLWTHFEQHLAKKFKVKTKL